jgi:hypothetical protein
LEQEHIAEVEHICYYFQLGLILVEVFESLTTRFLTMDTPLFSGYLGAFYALSHLILALQ